MSSHIASAASRIAPSPGAIAALAPVRAAIDPAALGSLEHRLHHVLSFGDVSDAATFAAFSAAYRRLEAQAIACGMPVGHEDAADWADAYLDRVAASPAFTPGTAANRERNIAMIWSAQLWHEVIMVAACVFMLGLTFYAIAPKLAKLVS